MATESFLATALPYSADPAQPFHVSVFVTHRLTPDGAGGKVGDFPRVRNWPAHLGGAQFRLRGRKGSAPVVDIPVTPLTAAWDADLWARVFPSKLPVRPWQVPDHTAQEWRTFAAHRMQGHALLLHAVSMFSSPVTPPTVLGNAATSLILRTLGLHEGRLRLEDVLDGDFDRRITKNLDSHGIVGATPLTRIEQPTAAGPMDALVADVHQARRYYQRPEEQQPYRERPVDGAQGAPVRKPDPDFHERAGLLGDLSPLLRRLGLIIDLRIDDPALLVGLSWIQAEIVVPELANPVGHQPRVACKVVGTTFSATSTSGDYEVGMVRLGDEKRFTVLDVDPDASGLKLEQYVRNVPRLVAAETNGDRVNGAPSTLRAAGFGIAREGRADHLHRRLDGAAAKDAALLAGTAPPLELEQVSRGLRFEVWDDVSGVWHSLHHRLLTVDVKGAGRVLDAVPDTGFLQGAALTQADGKPSAPKHAHEVLAGWDGWSLSAPRPGNVVVHEDGEEKVLEEPPPDPAPSNPVASTTTVAPDSLPRLRYGRRYAFRAYAVDLAGNSAPHAVEAPAGEPDSGAAGSAAEAAAAHAATLLGAKPSEATLPHRTATEATASAIREQLRVRRPPTVEGPVAGRGAPGISADRVKVTGSDELDHIIESRLAGRLAAGSAVGSSRQSRVEEAFGRRSSESPELLRRTDVQTPPPVFATALSTLAAAQPGLVAGDGLSAGPLLVLLGDLITTPRPFLRWDPLIEPAAVPRHPFSEGESLLRLVVRSGVEQASPGDLTLTVTPPAPYAAQVLAAHPTLGLAWREDSQRHLAPPKTSQFEAELHGLFDAAIGGGAAGAVSTALGIALRESGTFLDDTVADLARPGGRLPQPNVHLHTTPTADTPLHAEPGDVPRGAGLTPGQYVAHDVDAVEVPYLPDPLAAGVSFTFPDAGHHHLLTGLLALEGTTIRYPGTWPTPQPLRLVLESGPELGAVVDDHVVRVTLPPGEQLRMRMSSCLERASLDLFGLWRSLPEAVKADPITAEAAADGWFWWLTPSAEVRLVHAVPKPVEVPRFTLLIPLRAEGNTQVGFFGAVDVHGPSTERVDVEAAWSEWVDDVTKPGPERVDAVGAAFGTTVDQGEDLVVLYPSADTIPMPGGASLRLHEAVHKMGDTRHRDVDYRARATTRYREYFSPLVTPSVDDLSVVGPTARIDVPSSARPPKVVVRDVLPLFRWDERTEPSQPFGLRRTRRAGLRLYFDRPWYVTGDGELLGVLVAQGTDTTVEGSVSQWAGDPVWLQQGPASRADLPLVDLLHLVGIDDRPEPGRPVRRPASLPLIDVPGHPSVSVLGYQPEYSPDRRMWFVDVAFDPGASFWPFVRLAVARYQPSSVGNLHLGPVTVCDFAQLAPERTVTLTRPDDRHARVTVSGPVGLSRLPTATTAPAGFVAQVAANRVMRARLERRDPSVGSDLGWVTIGSKDLPILGAAATVVSWSGQMDLPVPLPPRTPGDNPDWRITLEERERMLADPLGPAPPVVEERIVYADHLRL